MKIFNCFFLLLLLSVFESCTTKNTSQTGNTNPASIITLPDHPETLSGRELSLAVCGSCHVFPEPELLPREVWEKGVLPEMALRVGVVAPDVNPYQRLYPDEIDTLLKRQVYPLRPLLDSVVWSKIVQYYQQHAPVTPLPQEKKIPVTVGLKNFDVIPLELPNQRFPITTLTKFDRRSKQLYAGTRLGELFVIGADLRVKQSFRPGGAVSDVVFMPKQTPAVLTMGNMDPNDQYQGKLLALPSDTLPDSFPSLIPNLPRPVNAELADLNQDGKEDMVICSYGNNVGKVAWHEKTATGYREHVLKAVAGARKAVVNDFDQDGLPDIMVLFAQGNENISIFYNQGKNRFAEKMVLYFPPVYGSSYFALADFNHDGYPDIVYTNGDNADYSYALKKYHGVRVYLNDQKNQFNLAWFYPLHGASQAVARDFDGDNDLDIAAIAFFPDYEQQPEEGFVYFENEGSNRFKPYTFPNAALGRWLTMDAADIDQDGDEDIILGAFAFSPNKIREDIQLKWMQSGADVLILKNTRFGPRQQ